MTRYEAAVILAQHNLWRRGAEDIEMAHPWELGQAIDVAVAELTKADTENWRSE